MWYNFIMEKINKNTIRNLFEKLSVVRMIMLVALAVVIVFIVVSLAHDIRGLVRSGGSRINQEKFRALLERRSAHQALTAHDADSIRPWMTFDYLNHVFQLPPEYLKNTFHISDAYYPSIVIQKEASALHISPEVFLEQIKDAVRGYLNSNNRTP